MLAALVMLTLTVKPTWAVATPKHSKAAIGKCTCNPVCSGALGAGDAVHQGPAGAEPEGQEYGLGYGEGGELGTPEGGSQDQGHILQYAALSLRSATASDCTDRVE